MFNSWYIKFLRLFSFLLFIVCFYSCKKELSLDFTENVIIDKGETNIEINIPKAKGNSKTASQINTTLERFVSTVLNIEASNTPRIDTKKSIENFKKAYTNFKVQIGKTLYTELPMWDVLIDGEVLYQSETLVSIAMSSSINTGGSHSNLVFKFLNFNAKTGEELTTNDLVNDVYAFTELAKKYYTKELLSANEKTITAFKGDTYNLPENLGFSDDGIIIFYDTFNSPSNNIIEFTIPFIIADPYLNF